MSHDTSDTSDDSASFGIWPSVVGFGFACAVIVLMFALATGFR